MNHFSHTFCVLLVGLFASAHPIDPAAPLPPALPVKTTTTDLSSQGHPMLNFLSRLFGKKPSTAAVQKDTDGGVADEPLVKVYDKYGKEVYITRKSWVEQILPDALEESRDDPDQLYGILVDALEEGVSSTLISYGELLRRTDPNPVRGGTLLSIIYMRSERLDEAESVLLELIAEHGESGIVLTNLAKVQSYRGDGELAEKTLWHALELDPNQENGLAWYIGIQRERDGAGAEVEGLRRLAAIDGSWRPQLGLARFELNRDKLAAARVLYEAALSRAGSPAPGDMLMQISGDLGNHGYIAEVLELVEPKFIPAIHGLLVGGNLVQAHLEMGHFDEAKAVLNELYALDRPDWKATLRTFEAELDQARRAATQDMDSAPLSVIMAAFEGPLWTQDGSPLRALAPKKDKEAPTVVFFGSTVFMNDAPSKAQDQPIDLPGRISRGLPLMLAESVQLETDGQGIALIPWVQDHGFAVTGAMYEDSQLSQLAAEGSLSADFVAAVTLDTRGPKWELVLHLVRVADSHAFADERVGFAPDEFGVAALSMMRKTRALLVREAGLHATVKPTWYTFPPAPGASEYLILLEQLLAVHCTGTERFEGGELAGEHQILDSALQLCLDNPTSDLFRVLLASLMHEMRAARPGMVEEYQHKLELLEHDHPLPGETGRLAQETIDEIFVKQ